MRLLIFLDVKVHAIRLQSADSTLKKENMIARWVYAAGK
jgi:hypothetical protein